VNIFNSLFRYYTASSSYLDAVIEQEISMNGASMFWLDTLHDCHLDRSLPLPYDRYRLVDGHRTGRGTSVSFDFGRDLSHQFLSYASSNDITLEYLALTCYYAFLFKLTNGERDLCIGMNTHGRYKEELMSVIGMFVNAIPLRCQLDPHWSFHKLIEYVQEMMINSLKYSYFPLQRILAQHPNVSKPAFLDTSFVFFSAEGEHIETEVRIGDSRLLPMPISIKISENEIMSKFDFALTIQCNRSINQLSCTIDASLDLFDTSTVDKIAQRYLSMLEQLFNIEDLQIKKPIYGLSSISSDERLLMQSMNNTQVLFHPVSCIHHEFIYQAMKYPQKLAVELDDQSLTYSELLCYVQVLSLHLLNEQRIVSGDVICQCVERSLSMVSS
jgi:non-ribosomal peptide synthetase component F